MHIAAAFLGVLFAGAALLHPALATEDDDERIRALRVRFAEGQLLEAAGRWADALERFETIARVRRTPQVTFHLALCHEHLGRLRRAEALYRSASAEARGVAPLVVSEARTHLADLAARIPNVVIQIDGDTQGVSAVLDDVFIAPADPVRVDPGPHLAVARRDGRPVAAVAFSVGERRTKVVTLNVFRALGQELASAASAAP